MRIFIKKNIELIVVFLIVVLFILYFAPFIHDGYIGGDGMSLYYPAKKLLEEGNLNFWNELNAQY